jgi:hypothetical protein
MRSFLFSFGPSIIRFTCSIFSDQNRPAGTTLYNPYTPLCTIHPALPFSASSIMIRDRKAFFC